MKQLLALVSVGLLCLAAQAIPADPTPVQVTQPDGTTLSISLHGDEFFHITTTQDGYTVLKNAAGYYTYAQLDGDQLVASEHIARDAAQRNAADRAFLSTLPKGLASQTMVQSGQRRLASRNGAMRRVGADGYMDYERFKGLIILINYTDKRFSMSEPNVFYDAMVNTPNFTGYSIGNSRVSMTGSVRDYFYDNSNHIFDPSFDIVGPVDVNYPCTYPQSTSNADQVFYQALAAADDLVNFNDYDSDHDGYVDMVFFLVAGFSANYGGNNESYLWPHMYYLYYAPPRDGVRFNLYACSTELSGWEGYGRWAYDIGGIGTFCHEFGHVLGLPDLYDTDYNGSGGESRTPDGWSIMSGGSGDNYGRNPVGYSLYERYALGFTKPIVIDEPGTFAMQPLDESNEGYRLNTVNPDEFFLIENRQDGKWDCNLPGHGMMVARVDSSDTRIWWMNEVNVDPNHMYYELLRANYQGRDGQGDPFPGNGGVTSITNFTTPNLRTWDGDLSEIIIGGITEHDRVITFNAIVDTSIVTVIEDFEAMEASTNQTLNNMEGIFCNWDFNKCSVTTLDDGTKAVAMKKPSQITTSAPLGIIPYMISFTFNNPTNMDANARLSYSVDGGATWINHPEGVASAPAGGEASVVAVLPIDAPIMLRITQTSGHTKQVCYLDNIKVVYSGTWPVYRPGDVNLDGEISIADVNAVIDMVLSNQPQLEGDVNGDGEVTIADVNMVIDFLLR